jgi:hypothetical protein
MLQVILDTNFFFCDEITYSLATQNFLSFVGKPGKKIFQFFFNVPKMLIMEKRCIIFGQNFF